jgi:hypothetical protein
MTSHTSAPKLWFAAGILCGAVVANAVVWWVG